MNRWFFILLGVSAIVMIYAKVRARLFTEAKSLYWLAGGIAILTLSVFPPLIDRLSHFFGIYHAPSLLFLLAILFMLFRLLRQDEEISLLNERMKELAQRNALLDEKLRRLTPPEGKAERE